MIYLINLTKVETQMSVYVYVDCMVHKRHYDVVDDTDDNYG